MKLAVLQLIVVVLLTIVVGAVHAGAKAIVEVGTDVGIITLIALFASLPFLSRYLD